LENYETFKQSNFRDFPDFNFSVLTSDEQETAKQIVKKFIDSDIGKYYLENNEVIGEEVEFGLDKKLNPVGYYSKEAIIRGKIDKLIIKDSEYIIIDYKTGKFPEAQYHDNGQGILYALWFFRKYPEIQEIKMTYVFVEHLKEHVYTFKRQYLQNYATLYSNKIIKIEKCEDYVKNETKLCDYCDYRKSGYCFPET
jgi:ATP-dependent exoDNAse (exonuclease V) beta subunit